MGRYFVRRLALMVPSLLGISLVLFCVLALAPGDPFEDLASNPNVPASVRNAVRSPRTSRSAVIAADASPGTARWRPRSRRDR